MCPHLIQGKPVVLENPSNVENLLLGVEALLCAVVLLSCHFLARAEQVMLPLYTPAHWVFSLALPFGNTALLCWSRNCAGEETWVADSSGILTQKYDSSVYRSVFCWQVHGEF